MTTDVPVPVPALIVSGAGLTSAQFADLADVSPELEWLANITNAKTCRAYRVDVAEFIDFTHLKDHSALRRVSKPCHRLAQGHGIPEPRSNKHPSQAVGTVVAVRLSLCSQRRPRQSGGRSEAAGVE